jgi:hypothetical protein
MTLYEQITALYPELTNDDFSPFGGTIALQNDSDGRGDYIREWNHPTIPEPTPEQLEEVTP